MSRPVLVRKIWKSGMIIRSIIPLKSTINSRGWEADLYAIEVGTRGVFFQIFVVLFVEPRFQQHLSKKTLKTVTSCQWNHLFVSGWPVPM